MLNSRIYQSQNNDYNQAPPKPDKISGHIFPIGEEDSQESTFDRILQITE